MFYHRDKIFHFIHIALIMVMLHTIVLTFISCGPAPSGSNSVASVPVDEVLAEILARVPAPTSLGWRIIPYAIDSLPPPGQITYEPGNGGSWTVKYADTSLGWGFSFFGAYSSGGRVEIFGAERWLCQDTINVQEELKIQ
jgi:hypothetical protein